MGKKTKKPEKIADGLRMQQTAKSAGDMRMQQMSRNQKFNPASSNRAISSAFRKPRGQ